MLTCCTLNSNWLHDGDNHRTRSVLVNQLTEPATLDVSDETPGINHHHHCTMAACFQHQRQRVYRALPDGVSVVAYLPVSHDGHAEAKWRDGLAGLRRTVPPHPRPDAVAALACDQFGLCMDALHGDVTRSVPPRVPRRPFRDYRRQTGSANSRSGLCQKWYTTAQCPFKPCPHKHACSGCAQYGHARTNSWTLKSKTISPNPLHSSATPQAGNILSVGFCIPSTIISSPHMHGHVNHPSALIHHQFVTTKLAQEVACRRSAFSSWRCSQKMYQGNFD